MKSLFEKACNKVIRHTEWYGQYWNGVCKFWYMARFNLYVAFTNNVPEDLYMRRR